MGWVGGACCVAACWGITFVGWRFVALRTCIGRATQDIASLRTYRNYLLTSNIGHGSLSVLASKLLRR
jgi:hypothetical protein